MLVEYFLFLLKSFTFCIWGIWLSRWLLLEVIILKSMTFRNPMISWRVMILLGSRLIMHCTFMIRMEKKFHSFIIKPLRGIFISIIHKCIQLIIIKEPNQKNGQTITKLCNVKKRVLLIVQKTNRWVNNKSTLVNGMVTQLSVLRKTQASIWMELR